MTSFEVAAIACLISMANNTRTVDYEDRSEPELELKRAKELLESAYAIAFAEIDESS